MNEKDLLLWLYEQKDKVNDKLYGVNGQDRAEGIYREKLFTELNTYDKIIKYVKNGGNKQ